MATVATGTGNLNADNLHRRAGGMLWMLGLQFVLGMVLNLIGKDAGGAKGVLSVIVLFLHIVVALGLLVNSIMLAAQFKSLARWGAWTIVLTVLSGGLTVILDNGFFSFLMALGFLASAIIYVRLYEHSMHVTTPAHPV